MLGIKTPSKKIDDGVYSNEEYRTLWISHDNWKIGNIYEKPNIIFPRLNGIWKLEINQKSINGFEYDQFQVGKYDEKFKNEVSQNKMIDDLKSGVYSPEEINNNSKTERENSREIDENFLE